MSQRERAANDACFVKNSHCHLFLLLFRVYSPGMSPLPATILELDVKLVTGLSCTLELLLIAAFPSLGHDSWPYH
jgi:hypothetical protein